MKRWLLCLIPGVLVACAPGRPGPDLIPAPQPDPPAVGEPSSPAPGDPAPDPAAAKTSIAADSIRLAALAADSVRDEEMLDRLHEVTAVPSDSGTAADAELDATFDINVARYAEHERVRFYLDFFQGPARERMTVWLARKPVYEPMIRSALTGQGLPSDLVYLALIESGFSSTAVSRSRAVGMWQFMRGTARQYGLKVDHWVDERRDPIKATRAAAKYLSDLTSRFGGSHYLAAAAYNGGGGTVSRGLRKLGSGADEDYFDEDEVAQELADDPTGDDRFFHLSDSRYLRRETRDYVPKLIAATMIGKQPEKYGFPAMAVVDPYEVDSVPVTEPTSLEVVARVADLPVDAVAALNPHYIRRLTPPSPLEWVRVPPGRGVSITEALAAVPSAERITSFTHPVGRRETIRSIAKRYGLTPAELAEFNQLEPTAKLHPGGELRIPGKARLKALEAAERELAAGGSRPGAIHRVRKGESLSTIARRYRVTVRQMLAWNDVDAGATLRVGQRVRVGPAAVSREGAGSPGPSGGATHLVRRGETLAGLAKRYRVSVAALMAANGLRSARDLQAGRRLTIPS